MKIALISDVHGNLEALGAVLADIKTQGADRVYCLGDIVGYGADSSGCIDEIRKKGILSVKGNHDAVAADLNHPALEDFYEHNRDLALWTHSQLSDAERDFLMHLPYTRTVLQAETGTRCLLLAHGALTDPEKFYYIDSEAFDADEGIIIENLRYLFSNDVLFVGHSHRPAVYLYGLVDASAIADEIHAIWGQIMDQLSILLENPDKCEVLKQKEERLAAKKDELYKKGIFIPGQGEYADRVHEEHFAIPSDQRAIVNVGSVGQPREFRETRATYVIYDTEIDGVRFRRVPYDHEKAAGKILNMKGIDPYHLHDLAALVQGR